MTDANWADPNSRSLTLYLNGSDDPDRGVDGGLLVDDDFLVMVNAWWEPLEFRVLRPGPWSRVIDTTAPDEPVDQVVDRYTVGPRSVVVLERSDHPSV